MDVDSLQNSPVIIIGAGPAGLTAAYELNKLGRKSLLLEAGERAGGISQTVDYKGFRFDIGGHRFFSKSPYVNQIWREILGEDFLERPRLSRIYYQGHFFDYPLKALNALSGLGLWESLRVLGSYARSQISPSRQEETFEQWVSNRFGRRLYEIFFKTYTEKVWGLSCREISADWAAQRIKNLSLKEALRNALFSSGKNGTGEIVTTLIEKFHYPRQGPGQMWETCKKLLQEDGNPTHHGEYVDRIQHRNFRVEAVCTRKANGQTGVYRASHFISSMPLRDLIAALQPAPPPEVCQAAEKLRYRDYLTIVLILNRAQVFPDNWIYIHSPEVKLGRIQNYKNWSAEMVPDPAKTSLGLEYFLWENDPEWRWPDEKLISLGIEECCRLGLIEHHEVEDGTVVRMPKAYPVYDQNYHRSVASIKAYLSQFENLQTIGRNGLHRYNNQDHSMLTGIYAARNILGAAYDVWEVNTEPEYHENGRASGPAAGERLYPRAIPALETSPLAEKTGQEIIETFFYRIDPLALGIALGIIAGLSLFLATGILLLKGESQLIPKISLLAHFLPGFKATWPGAFLGLFEGGIAGFLLGNGLARLRNWAQEIFTLILRNRVETEENIDLLDKV